MTKCALGLVNFSLRIIYHQSNELTTLHTHAVRTHASHQNSYNYTYKYDFFMHSPSDVSSQQSNAFNIIRQ